MVSTLKLTKIQIPNSDSDVISLDASSGNISLNKTISTKAGGTVEVDVLSSTTAGNQISVIGEGGTNGTGLSAGLSKAWVNHNQATVSDSFNIASVTDNSAGDYGDNFTNNMANANYCAGGIGVHDGGSYTRIQTYDHDDPFTTSQATLNMQDTNGNQNDAEPCCTLFTGDLA